MTRRRSWLRVLLLLVGALVLLALALALLVTRAMGERLEQPTLVKVEPTPAATLIRDVTVFTGQETTPRRGVDVLIRGGRIHEIGLKGQVNGDGVEIIDGRGRTLLPGLVNAHVHVIAPAGVPWRALAPDPEHNLEAWLAAGVTSVYDLGGPPPWLADYAREVERGALAGPRIFHGSYPMTAPGSHPIPAGTALARWPLSALVSSSVYTIASEDDAREAVAAVAAAGVPWVKVIRDALPVSSPRLSSELLATLADEAHGRGLKLFVHIGDVDDARAAVAAGADLLAHMVYRGSLDDETIDALARAGTPVVATLHGFQATAQMSEGTLEPSALARALHAPEVLDPVTGAAGTQFRSLPVLGEFAETLLEERARWADNLQRLHAAGVTILVGTDAPLPGVFPGAAYHAELQALHEAGLPIDALLQAATWRAARVVADEPDFGAIAPGMRADLLLVEGDPLRDLAALQRVVGIWRNGHRVHLVGGA